jgi:hypothetical protein
VPSARAVLATFSSAGVPWLAIDMTGAASGGQLDASARDARILDIADPHAVPVTVNPFEPAPGYPIQAHADRVAGLFEAAFRLAGPVAAAVRAGLRQAYPDCGWDMVTGAAPSGTVAPPAVPLYRQVKTAVMAATDGLGYSQDMRADVHGFLRARLDVLWTGPAGRFLEGGHPVDASSLLRGNILVTNSGVTDDQAVSFLAGVLLVRLAEQLWLSRGPGPDDAAAAGIVVIGTGGAGVQGAAWFSQLLADIRSCGADIIVAGPDQERERIQAAAKMRGAGAAGEVAWAVGSSPPDRAAGPSLAGLGRRSAACGARCLARPCDGYELHAAGLLARDRGQAWLRLWAQTLVLAFLTGRPVPRVPGPLRSGWPRLSPRRRDCLLATVVDSAVTARAAALRPSYDPRCLTSVVAVLAARMLAAAVTGDVPLAAGAVLPYSATPFRAGAVWVIPQLRWLHEIERVNPLGQGGVRLDDVAPPLDFGLTGLPDWPGIRVRDRLGGLRRHPLSTESERNREQATLALLGDDGGAGLRSDLVAVGIGLSPRLRLRHAAQVMGVSARGTEPGWLEAVLAWPDQINSFGLELGRAPDRKPDSIGPR